MFRLSNRNRSKRRRINPPKPKARKPDRTSKLFENLKVYVHPYTVNNSRRKVLHDLIQKNGGSFTLAPDDDTTHVLVDEGALNEKSNKILEGTKFKSHVNLLKVGWLSASVKANCCLNPVDYKIPCVRGSDCASEHLDNMHLSAASAATEDNNESSVADAVSSNAQPQSDIDVEMMSSEDVSEEISSYDGGIYDSDSSCDAEWLTIPQKEAGNSRNSIPTAFKSLADVDTFKKCFSQRTSSIYEFFFPKSSLTVNAIASSSTKQRNRTNRTKFSKKTSLKSLSASHQTTCVQKLPRNSPSYQPTCVEKTLQIVPSESYQRNCAEETSQNKASTSKQLPLANHSHSDSLTVTTLNEKIELVMNNLLKEIDKVTKVSLDVSNSKEAEISEYTTIGIIKPDNETNSNVEFFNNNSITSFRDETVSENAIQIADVKTVNGNCVDVLQY